MVLGSPPPPGLQLLLRVRGRGWPRSYKETVFVSSHQVALVGHLLERTPGPPARWEDVFVAWAGLAWSDLVFDVKAWRKGSFLVSRLESRGSRRDAAILLEFFDVGDVLCWAVLWAALGLRSRAQALLHVGLGPRRPRRRVRVSSGR